MTTETQAANFTASRQRTQKMPGRSAKHLFAGLLGSAAILGIVSLAQASEQHHTVIQADAVQWGPAPASLPPGAQAAVLLGNPGKEGPFVLRLKFHDGFTVPPHRHSKDELVTVISGTFGITSGETVDRASIKALPAGSFVHLPAGMPHYAIAEGETVVQINGVGPFNVVYVNPSDDPRKKTN
ncbi:MAG: cupin domain-containing protein [Rhodomicrobiaceae bacterium]